MSCYLGSCDPTVNKIRLDLDEAERPGNDSEMVAAGRRRLGEAMAEGCGIVRERDGPAADACGIIGEIRGSLDPRASVSWNWNCAICSPWRSTWWCRRSTREESRGVHLRSDFPEQGRPGVAPACAGAEPARRERGLLVSLSEREE